MPHQLVAHDLHYIIQDQSILHAITLKFTLGCIHGILGPNGSGKSTLLKLLACVWKPACGHVKWNNEYLHTKDRKTISRIISLVSHHPQIDFDFLVQDIVAMGRYPYNTNYSHKTEKAFVEDAMQEMDVWHLRKRSIVQLSQGEKQRVYIAQAISSESPILLLDEPTANLDLQHQLQIWQLLKALVKKGKIVIVTTHDLNAAEQFCQSIAVLNKGCCLGQGTFVSQLTPSILSQVFGVVETSNYALKNYTLKGLQPTGISSLTDSNATSS